MKITKKIPIRPRGKGTNNTSNKATTAAIKKAFEEGVEKEVQIIPAKRQLVQETETRKKRVCAYCRVSTDEDSQEMSYELQVQHYKEFIQQNSEWEFAGVYADKGISGTSVLHRENFLRMIEDCHSGKIDLIITKQVSRFARNLSDCVKYIRELKAIDPPIGVYFETEGLNTLDRIGEMVIMILGMVAENESVQKSESIKWSYRRRWQKGIGIKPNWALLGYESDKINNWIINEVEAEIVRIIYSLYLDGYSSSQIAEELTKNEIPTVKGKSVWSSGSVLGILKNEKYCGDALCQKTVTIDFYTHKVAKNRGLEPQYFIEGHHLPIVEKTDWLKAQQIRKENRYRRRNTRKKKPKTIIKGVLAGFVVADFEWDEEFVDFYLASLAETEEAPPASEIMEDEHFIIENEKE